MELKLEVDKFRRDIRRKCNQDADGDCEINNLERAIERHYAADAILVFAEFGANNLSCKDSQQHYRQEEVDAWLIDIG